ncbi:uncharacterized protein [Euphorbia lathyris]
MKFHDQELFFRCNVSSTNIRAKIIEPLEPATLSSLASEFQTPSPWLAM